MQSINDSHIVHLVFSSIFIVFSKVSNKFISNIEYNYGWYLASVGKHDVFVVINEG
jgi:hypothetical protein